MTPSLVGIILILIYLFRTAIIEQPYTNMLLCFLFGLLSTELILYVFELSAEQPFTYWLMISYYLFAVSASFFHLFSSLWMAGLLNYVVRNILLIALSALLAVIIIPGLVIQGVEDISYGVTRISGPFYWLIQVSFVSTMFVSALVLISVIIYSTSLLKRRCAIIFLAASTILIVNVLAIVVLMQLGLSVNALIVTPIAVCIFVGMLLYAESDGRMFKLLSMIPSSPENKLVNKTIEAYMKYKSGQFQEAVEEFEKAIINDVIEKCEGNKTLAAEILGVSRTTLRRKLENDKNE